MKILFPLAVLLFVMANVIFGQEMPKIEAGVSRELARWRAAHYSDVRYKLNITLEKQAPLMKGEIEIRININAEGAKTPLVLDWRTTQFANDKDKPYANVVAVNDAQEILHQIANEHILIPSNLLKTGENVIKIQFASPVKTSGAAVTRYVDKEDGAEYIYSLFVPSDASTAFPVFDQPDLKARFSLTVSAPQDWKIVSNTNYVPLSPSLENNSAVSFRSQLKMTHIFAETKPISTYVFAFAAGDFTEIAEKNQNEIDKAIAEKRETNPNFSIFEDSFDAIGSRIYVRKSQAEKFKQHMTEVFRLNREAVKYLAEYFDYKFPFPKYDLVLIPEFPFGGMEHAGATFLRESSVIFPQEPTANDYISRGNLIFHEAAHQWFGDTVTMRWFDDLWLKEGFAEFMAYKTMQKVLPQYNAWKAFYERNKPLAYLTDSTRGTTPIYQEIGNLSSAKSAYGNIVYRKAPSFLKQAEFYLGADKFQQSVRAFLKQNAFRNAEWQDLVKSFEAASGENLSDFAEFWVKKPGVSIFLGIDSCRKQKNKDQSVSCAEVVRGSIVGSSGGNQKSVPSIGDLMKKSDFPQMKMNVLFHFPNGETRVAKVKLGDDIFEKDSKSLESFVTDKSTGREPDFIFPNYEDYGYGIFLLDEKSRNYVLANIQNEKDDFLRSMMWGALWDSVREAELNPKDYVELAVKNVSEEKDELTIQTILSRVITAMNYYIENKSAPLAAASKSSASLNPPATAGGADLAARLEKVLLDRMTNAETLGQRIVFYRAFLNLAASDAARQKLKDILQGKFEINGLKLKTKDKFDVVTRLLISNDSEAPHLLANLEKAETSDEAKRYAYAARAGIAAAENKRKFFDDFVGNKEISESWIEAAFVPFNSVRHADLTLPYLEKALSELPALKRNRKIFFVNGWLAAFIGGQRNDQALAIVNKFLADNPNIDKDLRLKILENVDGLERAVKIRKRFAN